MSTSERPSTWWGSFDLPASGFRRWRIGPSVFWFSRESGEIRISTLEGEDPLDPTLQFDHTDETPPGDAEVQRLVFREAPVRIHLRAALADRAVVVRPSAPLTVPSRETVELYVSSPVWLQLAVADGGPALYDRPVVRPSDTWFGANTRVGELCYSSRTSARLDLSNIPVRPQRAVSILRIENRHEHALTVDRLKLPAPNLDLHENDEGRLWTQTVTFIHKGSGDLAEIELSKESDGAAGTTRPIAGARVKVSRGDMVRAFGRMLIGGGSG